MLATIPLGALTQLYAGTTPEVEKISGPGKYLVPWARIGGAAAPTNDEKEWKKCWEWCEEQTKDV
jgi:retinol dehydrogenase 12